MESVLFGMFVIAIACDQFEAIFTDETLVEQVRHTDPASELPTNYRCSV